MPQANKTKKSKLLWVHLQVFWHLQVSKQIFNKMHRKNTLPEKSYNLSIALYMFAVLKKLLTLFLCFQHFLFSFRLYLSKGFFKKEIFFFFGDMKGLLKTSIETKQSIPYPKEVHFYHHHFRAQKNILNCIWRNSTITLAVPENQTSLPSCFTPIWVFFLCGLWLSHHLSFLLPSDLKGMQHNTDPRNRFGLNLIPSNREFKQLKRVTESICSKKPRAFQRKTQSGYKREKQLFSPLHLHPSTVAAALLFPISLPFGSCFQFSVFVYPSSCS